MFEETSENTRKSSFASIYYIFPEQHFQLHELLRENAPNIFTPAFQKKYRKDLSIFIFCFKVKRNERSWMYFFVLLQNPKKS